MYRLRALLPRRLHRQLALLFALLFAGWIFAYGTYTSDEQADFTLYLLKQQAVALTGSLAAGTAGAVIASDFATVESQFMQAREFPGVQWIALCALNGDVLVSIRRGADRAMRPEFLRLRLGVPSEPQPQITGGNDFPTLFGRNAPEPLQAWAPVQAGGILGWVHAEFDTAPVAEARRRIIEDSLLIGLVVMALATGLVFVFLRRSLQALARASAFASRLDSDFGAMLPGEAGSEEIDELNSALNWTSIRLFDQNAALRDSETRKGAIMEAALDSIVTMDAEGIVREFNPAAEATFGYGREEVLGRRLSDLVIPPRLREAHERGLRRYFETGDGPVLGKRIEVTAMRCGGEEFPVELAVVALGLGGQQMFTAYLRDISERRKAEQALAESEKRFRSVVENLTEIVFQTDAEAHWTYLNPAWQEVTLYSVGESLGKSVLDFALPEDYPQIAAFYQPLFEGREESRRGEFRYRAKDGGQRWVEVFTRVQRDEQGNITGFAGSAQDVTERRLAEERLRDQLHFIQELIEVIPNPIYFKDASGRYLGFNKAWEQFFGHRREDWIGKTVFELFAPEQAAMHDARDRDLLASTSVQAFETQVRDGAGAMRDTLYNKAVFTKADGSIAGIIGVLTDIGARKQAEEELRQAKEAAEAANRMKGDFLANMSHEIRTPMNAIIGMTDLALDSDLDAEQREYLGLVKTSADALLGIINEILDFSKVEAGHMEFENIPFDLHEVAELAERIVAHRAQEKGLKLACTIGDDVPDGVTGDPGRLRQILLNLLGNAVKFTERGEVALEVGLAEPSEGSALLHFAVRDTGIGIPAEKQGLVFEAFAQADTSTTRKYGGTGLGLAICWKIVRSMGGQMWVDSQPGEGSTFHFTLRFGLAQVAAGRRSEPCAPAGGEATVHPLSILLAEDNAINQTLAVKLLERMGHTVALVDNGIKAVAASASASFDLILMDVQMPELGGVEATQRIREAERPLGRHTPIVAMTANAMEGDRERYLAAGMDGYVSKPIRASALKSAIGQALGASAGKVLPAASTAVFDRDRMLQELGGDAELYESIVAIFLDEHEGNVKALREALEQGDAERLHRIGHALKGSTGIFDARQVVEAALAVEQGCRNGRIDLAASRVEALIEALEMLAQAFREERAGKASLAA